jgi:hypothetical protein
VILLPTDVHSGFPLFIALAFVYIWWLQSLLSYALVSWSSCVDVVWLHFLTVAGSGFTFLTWEILNALAFISWLSHACSSFPYCSKPQLHFLIAECSSFISLLLDALAFSFFLWPLFTVEYYAVHDLLLHVLVLICLLYCLEILSLVICSCSLWPSFLTLHSVVIKFFVFLSCLIVCGICKHKTHYANVWPM